MVEQRFYLNLWFPYPCWALHGAMGSLRFFFSLPALAEKKRPGVAQGTARVPEGSLRAPRVQPEAFRGSIVCPWINDAADNRQKKVGDGEEPGRNG
ncbi:hypothetical protein LSM04_005318 [Trypanosoma melophagium]|uniref:uncharacterized protein n=1 Tax=Trypanosoma melophagium TaxID=715481 RepID=UPI00351A4B99|nr:hypothetical protein LSM04_005318 [Trypanosoma melophagium]